MDDSGRFIGEFKFTSVLLHQGASLSPRFADAVGETVPVLNTGMAISLHLLGLGHVPHLFVNYFAVLYVINCLFITRLVESLGSLLEEKSGGEYQSKSFVKRFSPYDRLGRGRVIHPVDPGLRGGPPRAPLRVRKFSSSPSPVYHPVAPNT